MIRQQLPFALAGITIGAKQSASLNIGLFESSMPVPRLKLAVDPDVTDNLRFSVSKQEDLGDYKLVCHLQNFSDIPCHVTVLEDKND